MAYHRYVVARYSVVGSIFVEVGCGFVRCRSGVYT